MATLKIVGRLTLDTYFTSDGALHENQPGGSLIYAAVGARIWCERIGATGRAGALFPQAVLEPLRQRGVSMELVASNPASPGHHVFFSYSSIETQATDAAASRFLQASQQVPKHFLGTDAPDRSQLDLSRSETIGDVAPSDIVLFSGSGWKSTLFHMPACTRVGAHVLHDPESSEFHASRRPQFAGLLQDVNSLLVSESQGRRFFRPQRPTPLEMAKRLAGMGPRAVVVKRGALGATVLDRNGDAWAVPSYPATPSDLTGAGHAFSGGFAAGIASGLSEPEAAAWGTVSASLVIEGSDPYYALRAHPNLASARLNTVQDGIRRVSA